MMALAASVRLARAAEAGATILQSLSRPQASLDSSCFSEDMAPNPPRSSTPSGEDSERIVNAAKGIEFIPDSFIMPHVLLQHTARN